MHAKVAVFVLFFRFIFVDPPSLPIDQHAFLAGIKVRPVKGIAGCAYLDPRLKAFSYVWGPFIEMLQAIGYNDVNLRAATVRANQPAVFSSALASSAHPSFCRACLSCGCAADSPQYDWRLPPAQLEIRDGYFTELKTMIEDTYHDNENKKVVLMGHSLGASAQYMEWQCGTRCLLRSCSGIGGHVCG